MGEKKPASARDPVPIAFGAVAAIVATCVGAAIFLIPSESEVMQRLTADGKIQRLREIVTKKTGREPSDSDLLEHAVSELGKDGWDEAGTEAIEQLAANFPGVEEGFEAVTQIEAEIPPEVASSVYGRMASRSLAEEKPELAADIYRRLGRLSGMDKELTAKIVSSLHATSRPAEALDVLIQFREENGGELPESFARLYETLALESGQAEIAFDSARASYDRDKGRTPEQMRAQIDRLIATGSQAGRTGELIPLCDEYLATTPAGKLDWVEIIAARARDPAFDDPEFRQVANEAAKFCRWNDMPDRAFDLFRKLAALGDMESLEQCVSLHKPLLRESEMVMLLDAFVPVDDKPEYMLLAAQLHAKRTEYEAADQRYRQHLASFPSDADTWLELGGMWDATANFESALDAYRRGASANPDDTTLAKRVARTLVSMADYEGALDFFRGMPKYDRKARRSLP